jgi:hypothetical protein
MELTCPGWTVMHLKKLKLDGPMMYYTVSKTVQNRTSKPAPLQSKTNSWVAQYMDIVESNITTLSINYSQLFKC